MQSYPFHFYKADRLFARTTGVHKSLAAPESQIRKVLPDPFGNLLYLQDVSLKPGQKYMIKKDHTAHQIVLPLIGSFFYSGADGNHQYVGSHEVLVFQAGTSNQQIRNCNTDETINFLHFGLKQEAQKNGTIISQPLTIREYNRQVSLEIEQVEENGHACAVICKSLVKDSYRVKKPGNGVFIYVVNGSFNVQDRWMDHRDGIALWDMEEITYEALSDFSILLVVEVPVNS